MYVLSGQRSSNICEEHSDIDGVRARMDEEIIRIFGKYHKAKVRANINIVRRYIDGVGVADTRPGSLSLARLHAHHGDVMYVLTGRRTNKT